MQKTVIKLNVNGTNKTVEGYNVDGTNFVSIRGLCELLGVKVDYNKNTNTNTVLINR